MKDIGRMVLLQAKVAYWLYGKIINSFLKADGSCLTNSFRVRSQHYGSMQKEKPKKDKKTYVNSNLKSSGKMKKKKRDEKIASSISLIAAFQFIRVMLSIAATFQRNPACKKASLYQL